MSFAQAAGAPFSTAAQHASKLLRGSTLATMGRTVGIVVSAGALAAIYQLTHDQVHETLMSWRNRKAYRRARHDALLVELMGSSLSPGLQERVLHSRDAFRVTLTILTELEHSAGDKTVIRMAIKKIMSRSE